MAKAQRSWAASEACQILLDDMMAGKISHVYTELDPEEVYGMQDEYKGYDFDDFPSRLKGICKIVTRLVNKGKTGGEEFDKCKHMYNLNSTTNNGKPNWHKSAAERFLMINIAEKKHKGKTVKAFHESCPEHLVFEKDIFRDHVAQEFKTIRFANYCAYKSRMKREKKKAKK
jgi:hypothetical protein